MRDPVLFCRGELEQTSSSPDRVETKISGNVDPPNKQLTCAAIAEGACVSDLHAVWEVPHPPYVWNISALRGLNLTPALSSLCSTSTVLSLWSKLARARCWRERHEADRVCAGLVTLSRHVMTKIQEKQSHRSQERLSNHACSALSSLGC